MDSKHEPSRTTGQMRKFSPASLGAWSKLPKRSGTDPPPDPRECFYCGRAVPYRKVELWSDAVRYAPQPCGCDEEREADSRRRQKETEEEKRATLNGLLRSAGLGEGKWSKMRLGAWDSTRFPEAAHAYDTVVDYVTEVQADGNNWLYLSGPYGIGKTHLAVSAVRALVEGRLWPAYGVVWPEHCAQVQETWDNDSSGPSEGRLWDRMRTARLLLIDDLDKRHPSPWAMGKLYEIIEQRYRLEKPTIFTANRSIEALVAFWGSIDMGKGNQWKAVQIQDAGSATMSRIVGQLWGAIEMRGKDQRW